MTPPTEPIPTELVICTTCRPANAPRDGKPAGQALLDAVQAQAAAELGLHIRGMACLSACSRSCTVALQAQGKHTYVFGDLTPDATTVEQVLACARLHLHSADGLLPWQARPERLRRGIVARLMPLDTATNTRAATTDEEPCNSPP